MVDASEKKRKFVYILGPTASGKSDLALKVAEKLQWPILNCDSVQVYTKVDIGTAKPTLQERELVPHFLFDLVAPPNQLTAADYIKSVKDLIEEKSIHSGVFVGGSGFYVQALEKGLYPNSETPLQIKQKVAQWIDEQGFKSLFEWLQNQDPSYAIKISENDHYRIKRAAEVMLTSGESMTAVKKKMSESSFSVLPAHAQKKVALRIDRSDLRQRVETRVQQMLAAGFIDEVDGLINQGLASWPPMQSVGYKEVQCYLRGELKRAELPEKITTATMQLAKKQMTWFKRDPDIEWFDYKQWLEACESIVEWSKTP